MRRINKHLYEYKEWNRQNLGQAQCVARQRRPNRRSTLFGSRAEIPERDRKSPSGTR
jgi:hypothetical protein